MYALTPEIMRRLDSETAAKYKKGGRLLMQNAGLCAVAAIESAVNGEKTAVIFCGCGNNGGDGYVIAAELSARGWDVAVFEHQPKKKRTGDAAWFRSHAKRATRNFYPMKTGKALDMELAGASVIVDAVFGTGFHGALPEDAAEVFAVAANSKALCVAIDCPSGIDPESGKAPGGAFCADLTVCMSYPMRGIYLLPARGYTGRIEVCDIGMDYGEIEKTNVFTDRVADREDIRSIFKRRKINSHKGTYGKVLLICGSEGMPGAARLALSGALRMGPGLCELCSPRSVTEICAAQLPEAIYTAVPDPSEWGEEDIEKILSRAEGCSAVLFGCGIGSTPMGRELAIRLIKGEGGALILDADGVNSIKAEDLQGDEIKRQVLLTPHPKEFSRLTGISMEELAESRYSIAKSFASEKNVTLLLKGADTVIAAPDGTVYLNPTGNPGLAKGGSGDVLAGMAAGIAAFGNTAQTCGWAAAYLHGAAGDSLAKKYSEYGYLVSELPAEAAAVLADIIK